MADKLGVLNTRQGQETNILCPAQSYPMASFRYTKNSMIVFVLICLCLTFIKIIVPYPHNLGDRMISGINK